jgi:hypothetical protein
MLPRNNTRGKLGGRYRKQHLVKAAKTRQTLPYRHGELA